tara:strand:+ start:54072 stop:56396 length:2325 start_codon:yes stop_codon:yes gene_type:complete
MKKLPSLAPLLGTALGLAFALSACAADGVSDGRNDSFGGANAKSDSEFSTCQLSEVLNFVNESDTRAARLTRAGIATEVANNIVAHRAGPDGVIGTGDDDLYDDLDELDRVDFVGPVVLDHIVAAILKRCEVDLETRPFINADTFAGSTGGGFERDAVELEAAMTVEGITGAKLHEILTGTDNSDRTIFSRIAKARVMEAFSYSYDIDEMPWDSDSHEAREGLAFLPLSIESDRYQPDDDGGERELRLGTDIMDDIYFDSFDYRLTRNEQLLRGRVRWDTPDEVRRLLIAAKFGSFVDDNGLKRASKVDVRTSGDQHMPTLETDVMRGTSAWSGSDNPLQPVKEIYDRLNENNRLPDIGSERDVLVLDPKVHLRSTRSRFHLDLASLSDMRSFYGNGRQRIREISASAQAAVDAGRVTGQTLSEVQDLIEMADAIDSGVLIADRARTQLLALDSSMDVSAASLNWPDELSATASDVLALEKNRVVAETIDAVFHEFGEVVDNLDRDISATRDLDFEEYIEMFSLWQESVDSSLERKRTTHAFLARWASIETASDKATQIAAFNDFGSAERADDNDDFEDFETVNDDIWNALGRHLEFESTKFSQRQVEAAGSVALGLWFDQARETYVPASNRPFGNFIIDTMDMAEMMTREEWIAVPEADRKIDVPLDPAKVFHTVLVNEVQIELGNEAEYINLIQELQTKVDAGVATEDELSRLAGSQFVLGQMSDALIYLSDIKKDKVLDRLDDNGAPNDIQWVPSPASKGTIALRRLGDMD